MQVEALNRLPIDLRPDVAANGVLELLVSTLKRTCTALSPPLWKKLFGGITKDEARAIIATCFEEIRACKQTILDILRRTRTDTAHESLSGSCERLLNHIDNWCNAALSFEDAEYGSEAELLDHSRRTLNLCHDLKAAPSGISEMVS